FFQAEDGIRDFHVTGVQTCALPITFVALNYMLIALLGNVGRFLSIVILMLQLASSAGTYPVELLPDFFRSIHEYLPMTYSVQGLRAILSSGNLDTVVRCAHVLLGFLTRSEEHT